MNRLLDRWTLARKLALIGALALAMLLVPGGLYFSGAVEELRLASAKADGIAPAASLLETVRLSGQHRGQSAAALGGKPDAEAQRAAVQARLDAAWTQARAAFDAYGDAGLRERLEALAREQQALAAEVAARRIDGPTSYERHVATIAGQLALVYEVSAHSGLVHHPRPGGYFLQDATLNHLPLLSELLGQMRASGMVVLVKREATLAQRARIAGLVERARGVSGELKRAMLLAMAAEPALAAGYGARAEAAQRAVTEGLAFVERELVASETLDHSADDWWQRSTAMIDAQYALAELALQALREDIHGFAAERQREVATALALLLALGAGAGWLMWLIARRSAHSLGTAIELANAVAAGDLRRELPPVPEGVRDEGQRLLHALSRMCAQLVGLVGTVRDNAAQIATASGEIAQGNVDLSSRTEQQAASLQQTAASMEQMNATIANAANHAAEANRMADAAAAAAERGGEVVQRVAATMSEIESGSRRIADIVGTIDSIAFQTNILALNAAVEAARAGEQGRGFAVVAGEVRALSQRSAEAAREVRALIGSSSAAVDAGGTLARSAGDEMQAIVEQVRRVATLIGEITAAAAEQTTGVDQVNAAVGDLDRTTQQNAALVEQSAAAAASLRQQAERLSRAVDAFHL